MSWRSEYPFQSNYWESPYGKIHYLDEGPEPSVGDAPVPVVVMVHGNPTWSFFYRNVVARLRGRVRCIVPDHLGCGLSDKPQQAPYTLATHIQNLQGLLAHLGIKRAGLIVHDWGGPIGVGSFLLDETASSLSGTQPPVLEKLAVLNTAPGYSIDVPKRILLCRAPVLGELLVRGLNGFAWPATWMSVETPLSPQVKSGFLHPYGNWHDRIATHRFVRDIPRSEHDPAWPVLKEIHDRFPRLREVPSAIYWGMQDFCFHRDFYQAWCEVLPDALRHPYEHAGHYLLEDAREQIVPLLEQQFGGESV